MNSAAVCASTSLAADRSEIDRSLERVLATQDHLCATEVSAAARYAVLGPAQRIRPILALRVSRLAGSPVELTLSAACAVELLHCASLIIDDLPCMDDSPFRRHRAAVHVRFGESTAILAAFALVALAARSVMESGWGISESLVDFQLSLLRTMDCSGLIAGQALDLENSSGRGNHSGADISGLKTAPLFMLAVKAGLLMANHDANTAALLAGFGREFGIAFQMSDDLLDGEERDVEPFQEKLNLLRGLVAPFGPAAHGIESLIDYLNDRVAQNKTR